MRRSAEDREFFEKNSNGELQLMVNIFNYDPNHNSINEELTRPFIEVLDEFINQEDEDSRWNEVYDFFEEKIDYLINCVFSTHHVMDYGNPSKLSIKYYKKYCKSDLQDFMIRKPEDYAYDGEIDLSDEDTVIEIMRLIYHQFLSKAYLEYRSEEIQELQHKIAKVVFVDSYEQDTGEDRDDVRFDLCFDEDANLIEEHRVYLSHLLLLAVNDVVEKLIEIRSSNSDKNLDICLVDGMRLGSWEETANLTSDDLMNLLKKTLDPPFKL